MGLAQRMLNRFHACQSKTHLAVVLLGTRCRWAASIRSAFAQTPLRVVSSVRRKASPEAFGLAGRRLRHLHTPASSEHTSKLVIVTVEAAIDDVSAWEW